jgi:hypothetical protein
MFELAKAMKNHYVTFITEPYAQAYIDFQSYSNLSSFPGMFTNDSREAWMDEMVQEDNLAKHFANH